MAELSVITVTHNRREQLLKKLESLRRQSLAPERFELVVLVNGSEDGTLEALREAETLFRLEVIPSEENVGSARGRNLAARAAGGDILLVSDDDCVLTERVLERHLAVHRTHPGSVVIGPTRLAEGYRQGKLREPFEGQRSLGGRALWIHATGTNTSLPRAAFEAVGGYDESFDGYGGEDPALALALRARGLAFRFAAEAAVYHLGRQLEGDYETRAFSAGRAQWRVYKQHPSLEVGMMLGVHPLVLGLKRLAFSEALAPYLPYPRYRYERAYYRGVMEEKHAR